VVQGNVVTFVNFQTVCFLFRILSTQLCIVKKVHFAMTDDDDDITMFPFEELKLTANPVQATMWGRAQALFAVCKMPYYYFCNPRPSFCSYCFLSGHQKREKFVDNRPYMQRHPISYARKQGLCSLIDTPFNYHASG